MFCIESKIVHVGAEKIITLYKWQVYVKFEEFCFTSDDAEDYARSEIWWKACKWSHTLIDKCKCGALVECQVGDLEVPGSSLASVD